MLQEVAPSLDSDIVVGKIVHGTEVWGFHKEDITLMDLIRGTVLHQLHSSVKNFLMKTGMTRVIRLYPIGNFIFRP